MSETLSSPTASNKPKLLDQRVKASLTRQGWQKKMRMFYVYVLRSPMDSGLYIGCTTA